MGGINVEIRSGKFDYLFGRVDSGTHNAARSNQLALEMKRLGVPDTDVGHQMLAEHLASTVNTNGNISRMFSNQYGNFEVRDSFFIGLSGQVAKLESTSKCFPMVVSGGSYTATAAANATYKYFQTGQAFRDTFDQKFSTTGLAAASTVGALNGMFGTSMFNWAGIPDSFANISTVPGMVIRLNGIFLGQAGGRAAQAAVNQSK